MEILLNKNFSKKEIIKATTSVITANEVKGVNLIATGFLKYEKEDEDNKKVVVTAIKTENGEVFTSISKTIADGVDTICSTMEDSEISEGIEVIVKTKKTKAGDRDFLYLDLV